MIKYIYHTDQNEKLTAVKTYRVCLDKDLLSMDSVFKSHFPSVWNSINNEENLQLLNFYFELNGLKPLIMASSELFLIEIETLAELASGKKKTRRQVYLTNKVKFIDITLLIAFTKLEGCRQFLCPTLEDYATKFVSDKYF